MQIVIEIPEEDYLRLKEKGMFGKVDVFKRAIRNGTPLPKGHGALIDRDVLQRYIEQDKREAFTKHQVWLLASVHSESNIPAIIEADKIDCQKTSCTNCTNHGYCDYEADREVDNG